MFKQILTIIFLIYFSLSCDENSENIIDDDPIPFRIIDKEPSWSPDGKTIVYYHMQKIDSSGQFTPDTSGLYLIDPDGMNKRLLLAGFTHSPDWSPDGKWIVFEQGAQIYKIKSDGDSLTQLTFEGRNFYPAWSPDGGWYAYDSNKDSPNGMNFIWRMKIDGSGKRRIAYDPEMGEIRMPHWTASGNKLVHIRYLINTFSSEVFIIDSNGTNPIQLTFNNASDHYPKYSPYGQKILFLSQPEGYYPQILVMDIDGNNKTQLTHDGSWAGDWSPDGQSIVFTNTLDGRLWIINADGTNWRQLTFNHKLIFEQ